MSCMQNKLVEIVLEDDVPKTNKSSISFDYENFIPEEKVQTKIEEVFNSFKIVGTVFDTYIIIEKEDKVYFIDQHAAHERQLYDKIMASVESNKVMSQSLFVPIEISLNEKEINFLAPSEPVPCMRILFLKKWKIDLGLKKKKSWKTDWTTAYT